MCRDVTHSETREIHKVRFIVQLLILEKIIHHCWHYGDALLLGFIFQSDIKKLIYTRKFHVFRSFFFLMPDTCGSRASFCFIAK